MFSTHLYSSQSPGTELLPQERMVCGGPDSSVHCYENTNNQAGTELGQAPVMIVVINFGVQKTDQLMISFILTKLEQQINIPIVRSTVKW